MTESPQHLVVYLSPAGTTAKVAETILTRLQERGQTVVSWNLAHNTLKPPALNEHASLCLWLGTPVYVDRALPPVLAALQKLPTGRVQWGAGFAVYGAITSGLALKDLDEAFKHSSILPVGMLKVVAHHSQFMNTTDAPGSGRPNAEDLATVRAFTDVVLQKLAADPPLPLKLEAHPFQTPKMAAFAADKSLDLLRRAGGFPPPDQTRCKQCGMCAGVCPLDAISMTPWPVRNDSCIFCHKCLQVCPHHAYPFDDTKPQTMIRGLAAVSDEEHVTRFFV